MLFEVQWLQLLHILSFFQTSLGFQSSLGKSVREIIEMSEGVPVAFGDALKKKALNGRL